MWSKTSAITKKALLEDNKDVDIVDTKSSGVVVSETCIQRLNLVPNDKAKFSVILATNSTKKKCKLFYDLKIVVGNISVSLPTIILKELHFDLLLSIN